ncbi:MAG TPA: hypothetical protein VN476_08995 [Pyrinomonadaceae bacterium]|nr:hypothetical protein [Pyrinomonadaceae bacterium]
MFSVRGADVSIKPEAWEGVSEPQAVATGSGRAAEIHLGPALPQEFETVDISFTPGFSPVSNDDKKRGTVLTVS